jgi:hypothetical protein
MFRPDRQWHVYGVGDHPRCPRWHNACGSRTLEISCDDPTVAVPDAAATRRALRAPQPAFGRSPPNAHRTSLRPRREKRRPFPSGDLLAWRYLPCMAPYPLGTRRDYSLATLGLAPSFPNPPYQQQSRFIPATERCVSMNPTRALPIAGDDLSAGLLEERPP